MSGQGQESTILVPAKDPEQKKSGNEDQDKKPNGDVSKGKGKDEGKDEPDIVRVRFLSWSSFVSPGRDSQEWGVGSGVGSRESGA